MSIVHVIGYTLNEHIIFRVIKMFDAGGGSTIHTFGAYFGLAVSLILGKQILPIARQK
jgi:ammonium transporter Rh